jgi:hypothetical protein
VFAADVENPRNVVDRAESDKIGFRSAKLDQRLWPGGAVPYRLDPNFSKGPSLVLERKNWFQIRICDKAD